MELLNRMECNNTKYAVNFGFCKIRSHFKLIHDFADALATSTNNASVNSAVQGNVLRYHLLQFINNGLDSVACCYSILLIACDADLVLNTTTNMKNQAQYIKLRSILTAQLLYPAHSLANTHYLVLIIFLWELDVNVMVSTDLGDYGTLATNDLGMIFGIHSDGQLEAPESLLKKIDHLRGDHEQPPPIETPHCTHQVDS